MATVNMKTQVQKKTRQSLVDSYPIANDDIGWYFRVKEITNGRYCVEGSDAWGRLVSFSGIDPDELLKVAVTAARDLNSRIQRELARRVMHELNCGHSVTTDAFLDSVVRWWSNEGWAQVKCPYCSQLSHAAVVNDRISIGVIDGGPGGVLIAHSVRGVTGLVVYIASIDYDGRRWDFTARG